jgi:hypothetical protein
MRGEAPLGDDALLGYSPFNEGSGDSTADLSDTAATGRLGSPDGGAGAPAWVPSEVVFTP